MGVGLQRLTYQVMGVIFCSNKSGISALVVRSTDMDLLWLAQVNGTERAATHRLDTDCFVWPQKNLKKKLVMKFLFIEKEW